MSQESSQAIHAVLSRHYKSVAVRTINTLPELEQLVAEQPDLIFLGMKFVPVNPELGQFDPEKIWLAEYFDTHSIAYTGSNHVAHQLELDKSLAKYRIQDGGLNTSRFQVIRQNRMLTAPEINLNYPVFVKPVNRGGGLGIDSDSVAHTYAQLHAKVLSIATKHQSDSLVEEYLPGREFSVAILKGLGNQTSFIMPIELTAPIDPHGIRVLSSAVKSANAERVREVTDTELRSQITSLAQDVFEVLEARDYGRIDIRLDKKGIPQFLEANLIPSLISGYGSFPKACVINENLGYEQMILHITELALLRTAPEEPELETGTLYLRMEPAQL